MSVFTADQENSELSRRSFRELRLRGISQKLLTQLNNVCSWMDMDACRVLTPVIREFLEKQPDHWKETNAKNDDALEDYNAVQQLRDISDHVGVPMSVLIKKIKDQYKK